MKKEITIIYKKEAEEHLAKMSIEHLDIYYLNDDSITFFYFLWTFIFYESHKFDSYIKKSKIYLFYNIGNYFYIVSTLIRFFSASKLFLKSTNLY